MNDDQIKSLAWEVMYKTAVVLIKRRREQMFVHSYIYYTLGDNLITDDNWQRWADELTHLQKTYGYEIDFYDEQFKEWTGATGCHLKTPRWAILAADELVKAKQDGFIDEIQKKGVF